MLDQHRLPPGTDTAAPVLRPDVLRRMVAAYATNSVSVQLDDTLHYFVGPDESGLIGYQERAGVAVALGDPLCAPGDTVRIVTAFLARRSRARSRVLFVSASEHLASVAPELGFDSLKIGEEAVFDLDRYSFNGGSMKRLRYHEGRARRRGVSVVNIASADLPSHSLAAAIDAVTRSWVAQHAVGPFGFLLALRPLHEPDKQGKRVFVACVNGKPIAFLTAVPIPAANGVYLEDYVRGSGVPDGTVELLFHEACIDSRARGYEYVSLGTAPLAGLTPADIRHHPVAGWLLRTAFDRVSWPYDFRSLLAFKARFHPTRWVPKYLVYDGPFTARSAAALTLAYLPDIGPSNLIRRIRNGRGSGTTQ
jgi:phosphatidylglycerol lysyltransferase